MMRKALPIVLLSGVLVACGIPDLKPFSDATAEMSTVLKQGFERTRASLGAATETATDDDTEKFNAQLHKLDERWKETRKALSSLVAYSDSLAAIAEAEAETGLPADDPVRFSPERLVDAILDAR